MHKCVLKAAILLLLWHKGRYSEDSPIIRYFVASVDDWITRALNYYFEDGTFCSQRYLLQHLVQKHVVSSTLDLRSRKKSLLPQRCRQSLRSSE